MGQAGKYDRAIHSQSVILSKVAQGKRKMIEKVKFGVHNEMREKIIKKNTHKFVRLV